MLDASIVKLDLGFWVTFIHPRLVTGLKELKIAVGALQHVLCDVKAELLLLW
jgi:hypothetical protein